MTTPLLFIERDSFSLQKVYTHVLKVVKSTKSSRHRRRDAFLFFIREKNLLARLSLCATAEIVSDSSVDLTAKEKHFCPMSQRRSNENVGVKILYATETGNARDVAEKIGRECSRNETSSVSVASIDTYDVKRLPTETRDIVLFVCSTMGQGDSPKSFEKFWKFLLKKNLPLKTSLRNVRFGVFGLGDSSYEKYNFVAKKLQRRLEQLGGESVIDLGLGDDQHFSGYDGGLDVWLEELYTKVFGIEFYREKIVGFKEKLDTCPIEVSFIRDDGENEEDESVGDTLAETRIGVMHAVNSMATDEISHSDDMYWRQLKVIKNECCTSESAVRQVHHIEFDNRHTDMHDFSPGDVLEVLPCSLGANEREVLDLLINSIVVKTSSDGEYQAIVDAENLVVSVSSSGTSSPTENNHYVCHAKYLVAYFLDCFSASPRSYFFQVCAYFAKEPLEKEKLQHFASPEGRADCYQYCQRERRSVKEFFDEFTSVKLPLEWLLHVAPKLKPRQFSISSSPSQHKNTNDRIIHVDLISITVAVAKWTTPLKRLRSGLCSTWLAERLKTNDNVYARVVKSGGLPYSDKGAMILIGPGTGVAPFRSFILERCSRRNYDDKILMFFGCRRKAEDNIYKHDWEYVEKCSEGNIKIITAFSRDQEKKVYVQDKIRGDYSKEVWDLISRHDARIFVAGSSEEMPARVRDAIRDVCAKEGGMDRECATRYIAELEAKKRYFVEAW